MTPETIAKHLAHVALYELKGLDSVVQELRIKYKILESNMLIKKMPIVFLEGFRTARRQEELYNQKNMVTNAHALESLHQYGLCFDCNFKYYGYSPPAEWWQVLGQEGEKQGLMWGGRWQFKDYPHFELSGYNWRKLKVYFK